MDLTLKSLLAQSIKPNCLRLWIAEGDAQLLPDSVARLQSAGLEIRTCADLRSYKKIVPSLELDRNELLVIADDDVYYPRSWLAEFTGAYVAGRQEVLFGRGHRIRFDDRGQPLPYVQWDLDVEPGEASGALFPTGVGGVLYQPELFHKDVARRDLFTSLCANADDVWLYWMASLGGARFRKVGARRRWITWNRSQSVALYTTNATANDDNVTKMIAAYGLPPALR